MTKIRVPSDLHIDHRWNRWDGVPSVDCDVTVVIGDDVTNSMTRGLEWVAQKLAGARIVYVPGNHCFYWRIEIRRRFRRGQVEEVGRSPSLGRDAHKSDRRPKSALKRNTDSRRRSVMSELSNHPIRLLIGNSQQLRDADCQT